jgi:hypothetical protein
MLDPEHVDLVFDARFWMCLGVALVVRRFASSRSAFLVRRRFGHVDVVIGSVLLDLREIMRTGEKRDVAMVGKTKTGERASPVIRHSGTLP